MFDLSPASCTISLRGVSSIIMREGKDINLLLLTKRVELEKFTHLNGCEFMVDLSYGEEFFIAA